MIQAGACEAARLAFIDGLHQPGDAYYLALYEEGANLGPKTDKYTSNGECKGQGYTPGGVLLKGRKTGLVNGKACLTFTVNPVWNPSTLSARGALLYNQTRGGAAITVIDFGEVLTSKNGLLELEMPALVPGAALYTLGALHG